MKRYFWQSLLLILMLSSCQTQAEPTPVETVVPSKTVTATATPSATLEPTMTNTVTRTPRPTKPTNTPTITPIPISSEGNTLREGDELPELEPITLENLDQLQEIAQWRYGHLYDVRLTPDETQVVAATAIGIFWFDAITLEQTNFVPNPFGDAFRAIKLSPSKEIAVYAMKNQDNLLFVNTANGEIEYTIEELDAYGLWFSFDGEELYVRANQDMRAWDMANREWKEKTASDMDDIDYSADGETSLIYLAGYILLSTGDVEEPVKINKLFPFLPYAVDLSDDGRYIAAGSEGDANIKVWDTVEQEMIFERCLEEDECMEYSIDGSDGTVKQARPDLSSGPPSYVYDIEITPNGKYLIAIIGEGFGYSYTIYRFNLEQNTLIAKETVYYNPGRILTFSNSRRYITWGGANLQSRFIYDAGVKAYIRNSFVPFEIPSNEPVDFYVDPENVAYIVNNETGRETQRKWIDYHFSHYEGFHHSPKIVFGSDGAGKPPIIWNYQTNEIITIGSDEWQHRTTELFLSPDDQFVYYCQWESGCHWASAETGEIFSEWSIGQTVAFHPEEPKVIYLDGDLGKYVVANYTGDFTFEQIVPLSGCGANWSTLVGFLPDDAGYYCAFDDALHLYDIDGVSRVVHIRDNRKNTLDPIVLLADATILLLGEDYHNQIWIYEVESGRLVATIELPYWAHSVEISSDGKYLIIYDATNVYRLWGVPANP